MRKVSILVSLSTIVLAGLVINLPPGWLRYGITVLLTCLLPGWALTTAVLTRLQRNILPMEMIFLGSVTSFVLTTIGGLGLYYGIGTLSLLGLASLFGTVGGVSLILSMSVQYHPQDDNLYSRGSQVQYKIILAGILLLSAFFAFFYQDYSDFRGDEAEVVLRAVNVLQRQDDPIFSHTKAPAEILLTASVGGLYGAFDEFTVRIPFAISAWLAVLGVFLVGQQLLGHPAALVGAGLFAINGWLVSHTRTAQYQTPLLMFSIATVWSFYRFYQTQSYFYQFFGALFAVGALLCHYDGISIVLPVLYLSILVSMQHKHRRHHLIMTGLTALCAVFLLSTFYIPFILHAGQVQESHFLRNFGSDQPYNNWNTFYINALYYNSIYYVLSVGLLLFLATLIGVYLTINGSPTKKFLASLVATPLLILSWTHILPAWYAVIVFFGFMTLFLASPKISLSIKVLLWWLLVPFVIYQFIIIRPGNHYYILMPPLMLLAGLTATFSYRRLERSLSSPKRRWLMPVLAGIGVALYSMSTWYEILVFMRPDLEYMLTYPEHRHPAFWSDPQYPFDIRIGWGFPYRLGWQTVSELYRSRQLNGDWYGNDENNSITWYTLGALRNPCFPRYYFLTEISYHDPPLEVPQDVIDKFYDLTGIVRVQGRPRLKIYEFAPVKRNPPPSIYDEPSRFPTLYRPEDLQPTYLPESIHPTDVTFSPPVTFKPHPNMLSHLAEVYGDPRITELDSEVKLLGYDLNQTWARPEGIILLTLYWQAGKPLIFPYKVFVHLTSDNSVHSTADSEPACGQLPTYNWKQGQTILDRHVIPIPPDIQPGQYTLQIGLYEIKTNLRMDYLDELGNPANTFYPIPDVSISPPSGERSNGPD